MSDIHPSNPDFNLATLPLFGWEIKNRKKKLSYPAIYLMGRYHLNPTQAAFYAELMGLEAANDDY